MSKKRLVIDIPEDYMKRIKKHVLDSDFRNIKEFVLGAIETTMARQKGSQQKDE